jgi:hypothetical protein
MLMTPGEHKIMIYPSNIYVCVCVYVPFNADES